MWALYNNRKRRFFMLPNALFEIFGMEVHMYGICIAVGVLCCFLTYYYFTKHLNIDGDVVDFSFYVIIVAIALGFLAAKLFQATYNWIGSGFKTFDFMGAGLTAMGGFIGGAGAFLAAYFGGGHFYFKYYKKGAKQGIHIKEFNKIFIVAPMCILIAHAFGRIGCLMAGCCHGTYLGSKYVVGGIYMNGVKNGWGYYVPTQLYEALFLFACYAVLSLLLFKKNCNITMALYMIAYGIWRIIIEFFRADNRGFDIVFSPSQWMSFLFIAGGIVLMLIYYFKKIPFKFNYPKVVKQGNEIKNETLKEENDKDVE